MALGTGLALPKPGATAVQGEIDSITAQEKQLGERQSALATEQEKTAADRERTLAPMEAALSKQIAEPSPTRPHTELPQFKPEPIVDAKAYESLSYGLIAMAMIGGIASKGKWLEVGDSLNGALSGYLEGSVEVGKKRYQDYQRQFQDAVAHESQANKEFEDILTNKKLRLKDQMDLYSIAAAKYDRQDALAAAKSKNYDAMWRSLESNKRALVGMQQHSELVHEQIASREQQHADTLADRAAARAARGGSFEGRNGAILSALAERGASLPTGFRSKEQQAGLLNALSSRHPDLSPDEIADKIVKGQLDLKGLTKEVQVAGTQAGKIAYAENEIDQVIPLVREASAALPRGKFVPYNKLKQMGEKAFSDPDLKEFTAYMTTLSNAYDMLAARGGTDMEKRKHNRELFDTADSPEALERSLKAVKNEARASGRAARESMDVTRDRTKDGPAPAQGNSGSPAQPAAIPSGWKIEKLPVGPKADADQLTFTPRA